MSAPTGTKLLQCVLQCALQRVLQCVLQQDRSANNDDEIC